DRFSSVSEFVTALRSTNAAESARKPLSRLASSVAVLGVLAASFIGVWLLSRPRVARSAAPRDPQIVALYQRGVRGYTRRTPDGVREAIAAFSAVLARDSNYADAWNGLAKTYLRAQ